MLIITFLYQNNPGIVVCIDGDKQELLIALWCKLTKNVKQVWTRKTRLKVYPTADDPQ